MILEAMLISLCIVLVALPPKYDPAILIKEFQMGHRPPPDKEFWKGMRVAIIPALIFWLAVWFIVWLIIS